MSSFAWTMLWHIGISAGVYFLAAVAFLLSVRLEKDENGSLIIDPKSLHYRVCMKCYDWKPYRVYDAQLQKYIFTPHLYQLSICGYFWRVFWAFVLLPIGYAILFAFQTVKTIVYAPFMFLFGYYPWSTLKSTMDNDDWLAVEVRRISFPRVGKLELKPYLVILPVLYGLAYWLFPVTTVLWSIAGFVNAVVITVIFFVGYFIYKVNKSKGQRVMLIREYAQSVWREVCPLVKVKAES